MSDRMIPLSNAPATGGHLLERLPNVPILSVDSVHLWCASLALSERRLRYLFGILSADERGRARRFVFDGDRRRFVAARGLLREILARYLACRPEDVVFRYDASGRPVLDQAPGPDELCFNVSHAFEQALFAFSRNRQIGIDVEHVRPIPEVTAIIRSAFSAREQARWWALPQEQQQVAFFRGWTRKEACLKALGVGLSYPLDCVEVTFAPAGLLRLDGASQQASEWSLVDLLTPGDYIGALVVQGSDWHLRRFLSDCDGS